MNFAYYYTPCFAGNKPDDVHPDTGTVYPGGYTKEPGVDLGEGTVLSGGLPPGMSVLKYDDDLTRCVVKLNAVVPPLFGWVPKTSVEVLSDYPGLPGVI
ncbi:hypothetical protein N9917_05075 [Deltaproteobacteria bacterium]|nr:hypothetical protein [Deltaproteobacteria bacterium]